MAQINAAGLLATIRRPRLLLGGPRGLGKTAHLRAPGPIAAWLCHALAWRRLAELAWPARRWHLARDRLAEVLARGWTESPLDHGHQRRLLLGRSRRWPALHSDQG